jgi:homoserine acetyltransferase
MFTSDDCQFKNLLQSALGVQDLASIGYSLGFTKSG